MFAKISLSAWDLGASINGFFFGTSMQDIYNQEICLMTGANKQLFLFRSNYKYTFDVRYDRSTILYYYIQRYLEYFSQQESEDGLSTTVNIDWYGLSTVCNLSTTLYTVME